MLRIFTYIFFMITYMVMYLLCYQDFFEKFRAGTKVLRDFFMRSELLEAEMR